MREFIAPSLNRLTTLHLGGPALALLSLESESDAEILSERLKAIGGKPFCLGKGSNLLAEDGELPLVLIQVADRGIKIIGEKKDKVLVRAGAGLSLAAFLRFCLANELGGLEGLVGVPGSIGGAVAMNAGSFGTDVASCLHNVQVMQKGRIRRYGANEIFFSYRHAAFPGDEGDTIILDVTFALTRQVKSVIFTQTRLNFLKKKSRQPLDVWSAGCAFKNPEGISAGKLLEQVGFRGKRLGGMAFSSKHANFLINEGNGCSSAAFELLEMAEMAVNKEFGITLEREVRIVSGKLL